MTVAALAVSSVSLIVGVTVLYFTVVAHRRALERSHVDWQADRHGGPGTFHVWNIGSDTAHEATVRLWTEHEEVEQEAGDIEPRAGVVLTLPEREANGPEPVDLLTDTMPTRRGDPVSEMLARTTEDARESMISRQVTVEVVWRSRLGTWTSKHFRTG